MIAGNVNAVLKTGVLGNALFSLVTGVTLIAAADPLASWLGIPRAWMLRLVGFVLLPFAAHLILAVNRKMIRLGEIYYLSALDAAWVVGSAALLLSGKAPFTNAGIWTVTLVALAVADFMALQLIGAAKHKAALQAA